MKNRQESLDRATGTVYIHLVKFVSFALSFCMLNKTSQTKAAILNFLSSPPPPKKKTVCRYRDVPSLAGRDDLHILPRLVRDASP